MRNLIEVSCPNIVHERVHVTKKRLAGKIIHVVGPRKLENDLLVSFIRKETDADCCLTDFDGIEKDIGDATPEPFRLFLIDYREPRLSGVLKQAAYNGNGSPLARHLIAMYNSGKSKNSTDRKRRASSCGILYGCDSATALLERICSLFSDGDTPENGSAECEEANGKDSILLPADLARAATPDAADRRASKSRNWQAGSVSAATPCAHTSTTVLRKSMQGIASKPPPG